MGNPFDLKGPAFLLFYLILGILVNLLLRFFVLHREKESPSSLRVCTDPYKLAALRAGASETLRVVLFSLIDRGLLKASGSEVVAEPQAKDVVRLSLEQAVVGYFTSPREVRGIFSDVVPMEAAKVYCRELAAEGLMSDSDTHRRRGRPALVALILLAAVSVTKICIALSRGRHNVVFLIILTIVFGIWTVGTWFRERTGAGDEVLRRAKSRFLPLKERADTIRPGGMTNEASYLAALFGLTALPSMYFPYVATLFPRAVGSSDSSYSGGCGDGGGSSGGCGGGGCGGGCGGCGG